MYAGCEVVCSSPVIRNWQVPSSNPPRATGNFPSCSLLWYFRCSVLSVRKTLPRPSAKVGWLCRRRCSAVPLEVFENGWLQKKGREEFIYDAGKRERGEEEEFYDDVESGSSFWKVEKCPTTGGPEHKIEAAPSQQFLTVLIFLVPADMFSHCLLLLPPPPPPPPPLATADTQNPRRHDIITRLRWKHVAGMLSLLVFRLSSALNFQCSRYHSSVGAKPPVTAQVILLVPLSWQLIVAAGNSLVCALISRRCDSQ